MEQNNEIINKSRPEFILPILLSIINIKNILFLIPVVVTYRVIVNFLVGFCFLVYFILNFARIFDKKLTVLSIIYFGYIVIDLTIFNSENDIYLVSNILNMLTLGYITFALSYGIQDYKLVLKNYIRCARVIFVVASVAFIYLLKNPTYSMPYSYSTLFASIFLMYSYLINKDKRDLACSIMSVFYIVSFGSRGTLVPIIAVVVIMQFYNFIIQKKYKQIFMWASIYVMLLVLLLNADFIAKILIDLLDSLGISSRTLTLIAENSFFYDSGRGAIYDICYELISKHWIFGLGIEGLQSFMPGLTPHNTYIEIILTFGTFIGILLITVFFLLLGKMIFFEKSGSKKEYFLIFFSLYVPVSFIGAGVWDNYSLSQLLACSINKSDT